MFSILMSVYNKENPSAFSQSLQSIVNQTRQPEEIILVRDGQLTPELNAVINNYKDILKLKIVTIDKSIGLANALNIGAREVTQPWIMRFDSDDICVPDRIEKQYNRAIVGDVDLFGGQIAEFEKDPSSIYRIRRVPCLHDDIMLFMIKRNPFNHMTVCFKKTLFDLTGGYTLSPFMQDYELWLNMFYHGARAANINDVLVYARVGNGMVSRRGGIKYIKNEISLRYLMHKLGYINSFQALTIASLRSFIFILPVKLRSFIYQYLLRDAL